jgi:hypothetical protein
LRGNDKDPPSGASRHLLQAREGKEPSSAPERPGLRPGAGSSPSRRR